MNFNIRNHFKRYLEDNSGLAFVESVILLPIMITLLLGTYDIGQAIIINQKVTAAAHMAADLVTRKTVVNDADMADAWGVAKLVIDPYNRDLLGIDIVGIKYDGDDNPIEEWRYTNNMAASANLPDDAIGLGINGEGIVAISVVYTYTPKFSGPLIGSVPMVETSFLRGRKNSFVRYEEEQ